MKSKVWFQKALTLCLVVAVYATYSNVVMASSDKLVGEITVSGKTVSGESPVVKVNGEVAQSGRAIFSNSTIVTSENSNAVVNLGKAGKLELAPNTTISLAFDEKGLTGDLTAGTVTALNGENINVKTPLNDPYFPDANLVGYEPLYIPAGLQKFNGNLALKYARSRESTSDFDRARRQQELIAAIREKALSLNVLGNPKKVTDLITTLGNNLKTDLKIDEMIKLVGLIKEIDSQKTTTKVLDTSADGPLKSTTDPQAGYIIIPKKGFNDYSELRDFVESVFPEPYIIREQATVALVNASGKESLTVSLEKKLKQLGYNVVSATTATNTQSQSTVTNNSDKPFTVSLLKKRFAATSISNKNTTADVTITIGSKYSSK